MSERVRSNTAMWVRNLPKRIACSGKTAVVVGIRDRDGAKSKGENDRLQHIGPRDCVEAAKPLANKNNCRKNPRRNVAVCTREQERGWQ